MISQDSRLAPVYGINDWYYAYGENSHKQLLQDTTFLSGLVENTENRPFSIIDASWTERSPQKMNNSCFAESYDKGNEKFPNMPLLAEQIRRLGDQEFGSVHYVLLLMIQKTY